MAHATGMVAITNPTVNSYKRINAPRTISGATWSPNTITWTGNNRTHMVRVPGPGRFELRLPDGAANPYLLQAVILAAGMDGVATNADPGKRYDIDMYAEGHKVKGAPKLPLNLLDALRAFEKDKGLRAALGEEFSRVVPEAEATTSGTPTPGTSRSGSGRTRWTFDRRVGTRPRRGRAHADAHCSKSSVGTPRAAYSALGLPTPSSACRMRRCQPLSGMRGVATSSLELHLASWRNRASSRRSPPE